MIPVKCESRECKLVLENYRRTYYVDSLEAPCPTCGLKGGLVPCELIHLVVESKYGLMESKLNGKRYKFACNTANNMYRRPINTPGFPRYYTSEVIGCTCPECLLEYGAIETNGELLING